MSDKPVGSTASTSGIQSRETGESYIPSSVRADGSIRKEIRVRPGYKPPEDVEKYRNRATEEWRKPRGVPGAEGLKEEEKPNLSGSAAKNAKRREARKRAAAAKENSGEQSAEGAASTTAPGSDEAPKEANPDTNPEEVKEKEARKLAKKLRQARELQAKKEQGSALLPEQFEKVIKINELIRQLDALGFDANGEKKAETT